MKKVEVTLSGYDGSTSVVAEMDDAQLRFLSELGYLIERKSEYNYQPVMRLEVIE